MGWSGKAMFSDKVIGDTGDTYKVCISQGRTIQSVEAASAKAP